MDLCQNCGQEVHSEGLRTKKFCNDTCRYEFHNKKKKKWTLKKLAKHYQETGEYLPQAEEAEEIHLMSIADKIQKKYDDYNAQCNFNMSFPEDTLILMIELEIGHWQAVHGFTRPWKDSDFDDAISKAKEKVNKICEH